MKLNIAMRYFEASHSELSGFFLKYFSAAFQIIPFRLYPCIKRLTTENNLPCQHYCRR